MQVRSWKRVAYINNAGKLVLPKVFVDTPCNCALKCSETMPNDKKKNF
jgi:hypothetical protein